MSEEIEKQIEKKLWTKFPKADGIKVTIRERKPVDFKTFEKLTGAYDKLKIKNKIERSSISTSPAGTSRKEFVATVKKIVKFDNIQYPRFTVFIYDENDLENPIQTLSQQ